MKLKKGLYFPVFKPLKNRKFSTKYALLLSLQATQNLKQARVMQEGLH